VCVATAKSNAPAASQNRFDELMQLIRTGNAYQRAQSAWELVFVDDPRVVPELIKLLKDDKEKVRVHAANHLARLGDPRSTEALAEALKDSSLDVRRHAAEGLGKLGGEHHVPLLVELVMESLPQAGQRHQGSGLLLAATLQAISELSSKAPPEVVGLLEPVSTGEEIDGKLWGLYEATAQCLGRIGDEVAFDQLERADEVLSTRRSDYKTWYAVRKAMAAINPEGSPFDNPAASVLSSVRGGKLTDKDRDRLWVQPLVELDAAAVGEIEWALGFKETRRVDSLRRLVAVESLGEIGGHKAAEVLCRYLQERAVLAPERRIRNGYLFRVALLGLLKAEPEFETTEEACSFVGSLDDSDQEYFVRDLFRATPQGIPADVTVRLCERLLSPPTGNRLTGKYAPGVVVANLPAIGGVGAGDLLSRVLLESGKTKLKALAAKGLGTIKNYDAIPTLVKTSKMSKAPLAEIARALGRCNDRRALPVLIEMAGRDKLGRGAQWWTAAALARLGYDYDENAAIVREALPKTLEQAAWLDDKETIEAIAALIRQRRDVAQAVKTLEAIGTEEAVEKALNSVSSLIDLDSPPEAEKLEWMSRAAARLARNPGSRDERHYRHIAAVCEGVPDWFEIHQRVRPRPEGRSSYEAVRHLPGLARKLWMAEATRRLDLAAQKEGREKLQYNIPGCAVRAVDDIFDPELVPVLKRIAEESQSKVDFHGRYQRVDFYNVRSLAARILAEKTGQMHTFVDVDGRVHPGGWDPSREQ
jgi:HEAT repeat protein